MKIALVNAQTINNKMREMYGYHENLGLGLIHACLEKENYNVVSYDLRIQRLNEYEMADIIIKEKFSVVAFSVNYATMESAVLIAQLIKFCDTDVYVVFGGEHATYLDVDILERYSFVDAVVRGEGEKTFIELIKCLKKDQNFKTVEGITFSKHGKIIRNENRKPISDLDTIPFASKQLVEMAIKNNMPIEIGILAQRGCPFTCSFCNAYKFFSNEFGIGQTRTRSPENVVLEMQQLYPYFQNNHKMILHFYDATFVTKSKKSREWIEKFIDLLEKSEIRIPFDAFIRADSFDFNNQEDINLIERMKGVGFIGTYLGLEAGDDEVLELYNKKVHTNDSHYTIEKLYNMGIEGSTNGVICFHQAVSLKEVKNTVSFLKNIGFCSLWNVSSRAETLPGINLSKDMQLKERCNLWDVQNYSFHNKEVEEIYDIIMFIKENYFVAQYEDYLIRRLREQVKLEIFYKNTQRSHEIREELEKHIHDLQNLTYCFMIDLIEKLESGEEINRSIYKNEIVNYVNDLCMELSIITNQFFSIIMMGDIIMEKKVNRDINAKLLVSAFFWGGSSIAAKILMQYASPPISTFARFGGAAVMLFLIVRIPAGKIKISLNEHIKLAVLGLVGVSLCYYFYFRGLEISSTFNAALFEATTPLLTFLIALICRKESFNKLQFIGLLVAYFGVMVIAAQGNMRNIIEMKFNFGDLLLLASTVCFAVYNILCKEFTTTLSSTLETFYIFAYGTIGLIPWLIMSIRENMKVDLILNIYSIGCIAFLAIGSSAIAYLFFNQGIEKIGASKASECINLVPVIAIILTLIVLKDIPQMYQIVGAIIILLGVYISKKVNSSLFNKELSLAAGVEKSVTIKSACK